MTSLEAFAALRARHEISEARCTALLTALCDVMATLGKSAGSPREQQVYAIALALLAEHGKDPGATARERHELAYARWEAQKR